MLLLLIGLLACAHHSPVVELGTRPLLLWRVETPAGVSSLLGTCHLPIPLDHALPPEHQAALDGARVVIGELALDQIDRMARLSAIQSNSTLRSKLGDDDFARLVRHLGPKVPAPIVNRFPAWLALGTAQVTPSALTAPRTAGGASFLDRDLQLRATEHTIPILALETLEQQVSMLEAHDGAFVKAIHTLADGRTAASATNELLEACAATDPSRMKAVVRRMSSGEFDRTLIADRNRAWMPALREQLGKGGAFVAVGAAHTVGKEGLVELMRAEGWEVTPLRAASETATWTPPHTSSAASEAWLAPPSPEAVHAWSTAIYAALGATLCTDGGILRAKLPIDAATCASRIHEAAELCSLQLAASLPMPADLPALPKEEKHTLIVCVTSEFSVDMVRAGILPALPAAPPAP